MVSGRCRSANGWFERAVELGARDSQFNLGVSSVNDVGMPQGLDASCKWFALTAKACDEDAGGKRTESPNGD